MHITKVLETTVDIDDPNELFTYDYEQIIKNKLTDRYANKCYQSVLITGINKIIRRSSIKMTDNRIDGGAYVDVQFEISGIIFAQGELLAGCRVIEIHPNAIIAVHPHATIKLQKDSNNTVTKILKIGQTLPVIVQKVRYTPNNKTISMIASPYIPKAEELIIYQIIDKIDPSEMELLHGIFEQISIEEKLHQGIKSQKNYEFFKDLLYPFKTKHKFEKHPLYEEYKLSSVEFSMDKILDIDKGIIVYPVEDHRMNKRFFHSNAEINNKKLPIVKSKLYTAVSDVLIKYIIYMQGVRNLTETYNTLADFQQLETYWRICKSMQQ